MKTYVRRAMIIAVVTGVVALFSVAWIQLAAPWQKAKAIKIGDSKTRVVELMGSPTQQFRSRQEFRNAGFQSGGYQFISFPGPNGEAPVGSAWASYSMSTPSIDAEKLQWTGDEAIWYELPLTAGVLIELKEGRVIKMHFGGT